MLDEQPYKKVTNLAQRIQAQINEQERAEKVRAKAAWDKAVADIVAQQMAERSKREEQPAVNGSGEPIPETPASPYEEYGG